MRIPSPRKLLQIENDDLAPALAAALKGGDPCYAVAASIADLLGDEKSWSGKLARLLRLLLGAPQDGDEGELACEAIDGFASEIIEERAEPADLVGNQEHHGAAVAELIELFLGVCIRKNNRKTVQLLARQFRADKMPASRAALSRRILAELTSTTRLCPDDIAAEIKLTRRLAARIVYGQGK